MINDSTRDVLISDIDKKYGVCSQCDLVKDHWIKELDKFDMLYRCRYCILCIHRSEDKTEFDHLLNPLVNLVTPGGYNDSAHLALCHPCPLITSCIRSAEEQERMQLVIFVYRPMFMMIHFIVIQDIFCPCR